MSKNEFVPLSGTMTGQTLGPYELHEQIGRGAISAVYRARHSKLDREVAIKIIPPPLGRQANVSAQFEQEARLAARIQHPHSLPIYDIGVTDGIPYMVTAYLTGGTLTDRIAAVRQAGYPGLPMAEIICVTVQIGGALDHAHQNGLIHRDVKTSNILRDERGNAYLADFGIAQELQRIDEDDAQGTHAYMAPEVAAGNPASPASDIYALGVVVFRMLTGVFPFEVKSLEDVLAVHARGSIPDLLALRRDVPPGVQVIVRQALSANPETRPGRATALGAALSRATGLSGAICEESRLPLTGVDLQDDGEDPQTPHDNLGTTVEDLDEPGDFLPLEFDDPNTEEEIADDVPTPDDVVLLTEAIHPELASAPADDDQPAPEVKDVDGSEPMSVPWGMPARMADPDPDRPISIAHIERELAEAIEAWEKLYEEEGDDLWEDPIMDIAPQPAPVPSLPRQRMSFVEILLWLLILVVLIGVVAGLALFIAQVDLTSGLEASASLIA